MKLIASMKVCQRCGQEKLLDEFAFRSTAKDGRQRWCRGCQGDYQKQNRDLANARGQRFRKRHPDRANRYNREARLAALRHYSGGDPSCACCGETEFAFLVLDHINGGGTAHRRTVGGQGIWFWLRARGYPSGYQVLCWNCNAAKAYQGICPHELARMEAASCA